MKEIGQTTDSATTAVICGEQNPDAIQIDGNRTIPAVCTLDPGHGGDYHYDGSFGHQWSSSPPEVHAEKVDLDPEVCEANRIGPPRGRVGVYCTLDPGHDGDHTDGYLGLSWPQDEPESAVEPSESPAPSLGTQMWDGFVSGHLDPFSILLGFIGGVVFMATLVILTAMDH